MTMTNEEAKSHPLVLAVRADPKVGRGSCSNVDECYDALELLEMLLEAGATTPEDAVRVARESCSAWLERGLNQRWGEDDDPQLLAWREFHED